MAPTSSILFYVDENLAVRRLRPMLEERGHRVEAVAVAAEDQVILATAEQLGAIVITGDKWFMRELFREAKGQPPRFRSAGVVLVPGEWPKARDRISAFLWLIEAAYHYCEGRVDRRLGIDLAKTEVRVRVYE